MDPPLEEQASLRWWLSVTEIHETASSMEPQVTSSFCTVYGGASMDYLFENLGPERFQEFCQALLTKEFSNVQCFPVGQPDGGRDAIRYIHSSDDNSTFIVYQVKYARKAQTQSDSHKWLLETVRNEIGKIRKLIPQGAIQYVLLTNVSGTAHLDIGSIDKVANELGSQLGIPTQCWWREDLCRRLDSAWDLKWVYTEVMSGTDMLRALLESGLNVDRERRVSAIQTFIKGQYARDKEVRFKQVELQNNLLDLFIDVPIALPRFASPEDNKSNRLSLYAVAAARTFGRYMDKLGMDARHFVPEIVNEDELVFADGDSHQVGAAAFFLDADIQAQLPQVVLEGAPGQGKSTLAQFVCQAHRLQFLWPHSPETLPRIYRPKSVRIPFKVDLRDLATWLSGRDPFVAQDEETVPEGWYKSLEAFLAALVRNHSGGRSFDVDDLHAVAKASNLLIVLDGFDEVADIAKRLDIVTAVTEGIGRLRVTSNSIQVIITSRPAAFVNSPGFPEDSFVHLQLTSITRKQIDEYAGRWCTARRLQERETVEVKRTLKERLDQPHLRELARNPMQLAILLTLIRSMGASLPDKRTALYDSYVERFFNREAEKSQIVQQHRVILLDIHGYLAWTLQVESEQGQDRGSISSERLKRLLRDYLTAEGRNPDLVDSLFTGMVERVVALVSRVEGTYEFEVQPLREYFAARYLYNTAPYSPAGNPRQGTKTERFAAMAKDFYWLNVARFYAGCYSKGELPSLVDGIKELADTEKYRDINHPRALAAMLLSDWVFTQHQRSLKDVVNLIVGEPGLRYLLTTEIDARRSGTELIIPAACGREEIVTAAISELHQSPRMDRVRVLVNLLSANLSDDQRSEMWVKETTKVQGHDRTRWFTYGRLMNVLQHIQADVLETLVADSPDDPTRLQSLLKSGQFELCESTDSRCQVLVERVLNRASLSIPVEGRHATSALATFANIFNNYGYIGLARFGPGLRSLEGVKMADILRISPADDLKRVVSRKGRGDTRSQLVTVDRCAEVDRIAKNEWLRPASDWATSLHPWENIVKASRAIWGEHWAHYVFATWANSVVSTADFDESCVDLLDNSRPLCDRVAHARTKGADIEWWKRQYESAASELDVMFVTLTQLVWGNINTVLGALNLIETMLDNLSTLNWQILCESLKDREFMTMSQPQRRGDRTLSLPITALPDSLSPRAIAVLARRLPISDVDKVYRRYLSQYDGADVPVLELCQLTALRLVATSRRHWEPHLSVLASTYAQGIVASNALYGEPGGAKRGSISMDAAQVLVRNSERYPLAAIALGEAKCRELCASAIEPVGSVADREGWFSRL